MGVMLVALAVLLAGSLPVAAGDPAPPRHLIYLHGRIVQEQQSARPRHPRFGYYEMEALRAAFRDRGFAVSGEIRPKSASVGESADRVVAQVRRLLDSGVPADRITVVGASMPGRRSTLEAREIVLHTGLGHGFLYRPLPEWVDPVTEWAFAKP